MTKPIIAISTSKTDLSESIPAAYASAVAKAGGLPLLISNQFPLTDIGDLCSRVDGILFSGGGDIEISLYNGEPNPQNSLPFKERDALELSLVNAALEAGLPILGICRGIQVINVALGGTLFTDIPTQFPSSLDHNSSITLGRDYQAHDVLIENDTQLQRIVKKPLLPVNSFHHQAIKDLAPGLKVTARATDGLIEAVEMPADTYKLIGVQWHPECIQMEKEQQQLFKAFVDACCQ